MSEVIISRASSKDLPEIEALIRSHGEGQVVDNPIGITPQLVTKGQFNVGRNAAGEIVTMGGWELKKFSAARAGRLGRDVDLQIQREVVTRLDWRDQHLGTAIAAHNQLEAQIRSGGSVMASVAAMFGGGRASGILGKNLGETMDADCFAIDATPGLPGFIAYCTDYAATNRPGEPVHFAYFTHSKLPELARMGVKMIEDEGFRLKGVTVHSDVLRGFGDREMCDLLDLAEELERALLQYGVAKSSDDQALTLYGRYSDLVA